MSKSNNKAINEIKEILGDHVASGKPCLKMVSCGEIMINELPFSFSMQNIGAASDAGICVTISGEAVNSGIVRFTDFTFIKNVNGKAIPERYDLPLVKKSDGKMIYQVKFTDIKLPEYDPSTVSTKEDFLNALSAQLTAGNNAFGISLRRPADRLCHRMEKSYCRSGLFPAQLKKGQKDICFQKKKIR